MLFAFWPWQEPDLKETLKGRREEEPDDDELKHDVLLGAASDHCQNELEQSLMSSLAAMHSSIHLPVLHARSCTNPRPKPKRGPPSESKNDSAAARGARAKAKVAAAASASAGASDMEIENDADDKPAEDAKTETEDAQTAGATQAKKEKKEKKPKKDAPCRCPCPALNLKPEPWTPMDSKLNPTSQALTPTPQTPKEHSVGRWGWSGCRSVSRMAVCGVLEARFAQSHPQDKAEKAAKDDKNEKDKRKRKRDHETGNDSLPSVKSFFSATGQPAKPAL